MRYLAFDIECANCYQGNGKICSFGYVITDESFNVLEKRDIVINPKGKFNLKGRPGTEDLVLGYSESEFLAAPTFNYYYEEIRAILEYQPQIVIGHAIGNDIAFLNYETRRYKKPSFNFSYIDSQIMYGEYSGNGRQRGLEKIAEEFNIEFSAHRSDEDAYATIQYVQKLCEKFEKSLPEAIELCKINPGCISDYVIRPVNSERQRERVRQMAKEDSVHNGLMNMHRYLDKLAEEPIEVKGSSLEGKCFCFNQELELRCFSVTKELLQLIYRRGGCYVMDPLDCNCFVLSKKPCPRHTQINQMLQEGQNIVLLTEREFFDLIGISFGKIAYKYKQQKRRAYMAKQKRMEKLTTKKK